MGVCKVLQDVVHFQLHYLIKENVAINSDIHWTFKENMSNVIVISVPANGMALLGGRASACTGMTKFATALYTRKPNCKV